MWSLSAGLRSLLPKASIHGGRFVIVSIQTLELLAFAPKFQLVLKMNKRLKLTTNVSFSMIDGGNQTINSWQFLLIFILLQAEEEVQESRKRIGANKNWFKKKMLEKRGSWILNEKHKSKHKTNGVKISGCLTFDGYFIEHNSWRRGQEKGDCKRNVRCVSELANKML